MAANEINAKKQRKTQQCTDFALCVLLDAGASSFRFSGFFDVSCPDLKSNGLKLSYFE